MGLNPGPYFLVILLTVVPVVLYLVTPYWCVATYNLAVAVVAVVVVEKDYVL